MHSIIQAGTLQVSVINKDQSVAGQQATVLIRHTSWHQGPDHQNGSSDVFWILKQERIFDTI